MTDAVTGGPVIAITGASSGLGLETARALAMTGARVLLICRTADRAAQARDEIRRSTGREAVEAYAADLSSQRQVREVAAAIGGRHRGLDVLINNAAVITRTRSITDDNIETQWAVNHLAPFLLTRLLLDRLGTAGAARIINVASAVHVFGAIDFADPGRERHYDANEAYCQSKLANVMFTFALARRLSGSSVTANCLHPGAISTKLLVAYYGGGGNPLSYLKRFRHAGPTTGARSAAYLALSPEVATQSGTYFVEGRPAESSPASKDEAAQERLWALSEAMTQ